VRELLWIPQTVGRYNTAMGKNLLKELRV